MHCSRFGRCLSLLIKEPQSSAALPKRKLFFAGTDGRLAFLINNFECAVFIVQLVIYNMLMLRILGWVIFTWDAHPHKLTGKI